MNFFGIWIAVAAIAVATQVAADTNFGSLCYSVAATMRMAKLSPENPETYEFAKGLISKYNFINETRKKALEDAWDNVFNGLDCSEKSWDYMSDVSLCLDNDLKLHFLTIPLREYVKKCFNFNDLEQRIKSASESSKVDFIDSKFIERYREDHPTALKVDETKWYVGASCCQWYYSPGALTDAIERNLVSDGKDPKTFFVEPEDVSGYLKEKLFQPCDNLIQSFDPVYLSKLYIKDYDFDRKDSVYESSLSQEANEALFRYRYCDEPKKNRVDIVKSMLKKFLPELEPTDGDKKMILKDCLVPGYGENIFWE